MKITRFLQKEHYDLTAKFGKLVQKKLLKKSPAYQTLNVLTGVIIWTSALSFIYLAAGSGKRAGVIAALGLLISGVIAGLLTERLARKIISAPQADEGSALEVTFETSEAGLGVFWETGSAIYSAETILEVRRIENAIVALISPASVVVIPALQDTESEEFYRGLKALLQVT